MSSESKYSRREALGVLAVLTAAGAVAPEALAQDPTSPTLTVDYGALEAAERLAGLTFTKDERDLMMEDVQEALQSFERLRQIAVPNSVHPALLFDPLLPGRELPPLPRSKAPTYDTSVVKPSDPAELAYMTIPQLAGLIRAGKLTSEELTELCLARLEEHDPQLLCVVTLTKERALEQARRADKELKAGTDRGPLHGIPWGAKDLLSVKGYPTTWGAMPYKDQVIEEDATVVQRLDEAGAVLVAKLTLGALAWGDVWFGGMTRNPWNLEQGSSGSSAGSASAVAAGLVPFAIGTETLGSIVSPSTRCGTSGLRPTFGAVSRHGAMALSWSMDKIGPIARTAEDTSLVLAAIAGPDGQDPTAKRGYRHFSRKPTLEGLRIGYVKSDFEQDYPGAEIDRKVPEDLRKLGVDLIEVSLPERIPASDLLSILTVEAAAAFEELTRNNQDDLMVRQERNAWPNVFRAARLVPGVEYVQANRLRTMLMRDMAQVFETVDCYIAPSYSSSLTITNLTGHPALVMPNGFNEDGAPTSITFTGNLYREDQLVRVAMAWQESTDYHTKRPDGFI